MNINIDFYNPNELDTFEGADYNQATFQNKRALQNLKQIQKNDFGITPSLIKSISHKLTNSKGTASNIINNANEELLYFYDLVIKNSINGYPTCSFKLIIEEGFDAIHNGDIISISADGGNTMFFGFIDNLTYLKNNRDGYALKISALSHIAMLERDGFLAKNNLINPNENQSFQFFVEQGIARATSATFVDLVPIVSDIEPRAYFNHWYDGTDSCNFIMKSIADNYARRIFVRADGTIFITQIYGSKITETFNVYDEKDFQVIDYTLNTNYSNISYDTNILFRNSNIITNAFISGNVFFKDYPYKDSLYSTIKTIPLFLNPNIALAVTNANFKIEDTSIFEMKVVIESPKDNKNIDKDRFVQAVMIEILKTFYDRMQDVEVFEATTILNNKTILIDVGDSIQVGNTMYTVVATNIDIQDAEVSFSAIPLGYTNPIIKTFASNTTPIS